MRVLLKVGLEYEECVGSLDALKHAIPESRGWRVDIDRDLANRTLNICFMNTENNEMYSGTAHMFIHHEKYIDPDRPFDGHRWRWFFYMANTSIEGETPIACLIAYEESLGYLSKVNEVLEPVEVTPVPPAIRKRVIIL